MPFLRRRGVMASESDMRRHTVLDSPSVTNKLPSSSLADPSVGLPSLPTSGVGAAAAPGTPPLPATPASGRASESDAVGASGDAVDRPESPPIQEETPKHRRFSMLRFRNASDSQLSTRARQQAVAEKPPPIPRPPEIITTAPTFELAAPPKKQSRIRLSSRLRRSGEEPRPQRDDPSVKELSKKDRRKTMLTQPTSGSKQSVTFEEPEQPSASNAPPLYSDNNGANGSTLALPVNRLSESSRSDGSSTDQRVYGSTTTTTHTVQTTTTFFRLPRRRQKLPEPLFPISHLQQKAKPQTGTDASTSRTSLNVPPLEGPVASSASVASQSGVQETPVPSRPSSGNGIATPPALSPARGLFGKSNASPATALFRPNSRNSGQSSPTRAHLHLRERSSTLSSLGRNSPRGSVDEHLAPPNTRTSSSTGRRSFGDLLGLSRLRQNSEPVSGRQGTLTPATPGSNTSKNNSLQLARESVVLPERRDDDTPAKYLARLEEVVSRSVIAAALSKASDTFSQSVLRSYMRGFSFFGDPMDMAIRKLLMEAELPKETQHIDRCLQAFANRYHECNPGIYSTPDQAYFIAFSLLILHTDVFNKNNKHKMQKADYLKNTHGEGIFDEILDVFYDNITYTPFIHVEDDFDINGERIITHKAKKKSLLSNNNQDPLKKASKEPIDPYTLILDGKLDVLRPNLKEVMQLEDHYGYLGTAKNLNLKELQKTFFRTGVLQIVSARSRPDAFMSEKTATNPEEAHPGIVDIKITKVGLLWRKEVKKRRTRSPWQEWGAILTGAQLYFFRNTAWVKNLMHQFETHIRQGHDGIPVIFKPPLEQFKPDALMSTDGAVALLDSEYKKHKHAFTYVRHGGFEEVLLADNEDEMNDWLAKLNYAAAFRTSGVRMRGVVGGSYDGQSRRAIRRLDSESVQNSAGEMVTIARSRIDQKMAHDILTARRDIMFQKVSDANEKLEHAEKQLETQLRNARHLQILAPIQPKTRDQMLLSATRIAAQLKWTRTEIWRLRCHRDILLLDLDEERQLLGLPPESIADKPAAVDKPGIHREESRASNTAASQKSPRSPAHVASVRSSVATAKSDEDSPLTDAFQTPPTSATAASFHRHQNSWEMPALGPERTGHRKTSVSSAISSNSIMATPPRNIATSSSAPEKRPASDHADEVDAGERDLLEQAGLIEAEASRGAAKPSEEGSDRRERHPNGTTAERSDRSKVRRSLHRTLREGAGHLSHHRSKKGRDSASSGAMSDETVRESDMLSRGSGSFVVHGKKASVINFGSELQILSPEERLRQRKVLQAAPQREEAVSPSSAAGSEGRQAGGESVGDFRVVLESQNDREHRESAASGSTATARSFRELHRKYSAKAAAVGGTLVVPSDEDSDAAVSFSEGRRSPLPPIEGEEEDEPADDGDDGLDVDDDDADSEEDENDQLAAGGRQAQFFTPEPPSSPALEPEKDDESGSAEGGGQLPSPPLQAVSA